MEDSYKPDEKDIEGVLRWLKVNNPEKATREQAVALLKDLKAGFHQISHNDPNRLIELQRELDEKHDSKG